MNRKEIVDLPMAVNLYPSGKIEAVSSVHGAGIVAETFYPLCGDAVQTNVSSWHGDHGKEVRVRPDTYTKRAVGERYR